jgi:adenosylcobinamide-GDP ribazoletransferase
LAAALWAFPLVGGLLGLVAAGVLWAAESLGLPATLSAVLALAALALLSGALHEDGLADVADGFGGGGTQARKMEILRDSRIGSYGVIALILAYALRFSALAALPSLGSTLAAVIVAQALGRAVIPLAMVISTPARADGLGASAGTPSRRMALMTLVVGFACTWGALTACGLAALSIAPVLAAIAAALVVSALARRQIGGYTGDVLGAVAVTAECAVLLVLVALIGAAP